MARGVRGHVSVGEGEVMGKEWTYLLDHDATSRVRYENNWSGPGAQCCPSPGELDQQFLGVGKDVPLQAERLLVTCY